MRALAPFLLLLGGLAAACRPTPADDVLSAAGQTAVEQAVLASHDQALAAAEARDLDRLFGFVAETDRGSMIGNGRLLLTRADTLAATRRGFEGIATIKYEVRERHVTALSRNAALLVTTGQTRVTTADGRAITAPYAQTLVYVLRDGRWQVLHLHSSAPR